ncbi:MAG: class I SAM-dependent methyltransferase [Nitrospirae bacterium]|nr:class I SAM-dependent methyltransferase [Nitrospirota bacterium]
MHKGRIIDNANGYDIIECEQCGFVHITPLPTQEDLDKIYKEEYYTTEKPLFIQRQQEDLEWWNIVYDDRYDFFEQNLSQDKRRLLDIGCGPGFFLKRGQERGWKPLGIEPSTQAVAHAKNLGIDVLNCFLDDSEIKDRGAIFDVVHMSEVLEHIPDPAALCNTAYNLLADGGIICVVVPNEYNPFQIILRDKLGFQPYWLAPPHHINYFNYDSIERLLQKSGFRILQRTAMFPMDIFLLMGDNYVGNDKVGRACHAKRKRFDLFLNEPILIDFKKNIYKLMAEHGIGRESVLFGIKK